MTDATTMPEPRTLAITCDACDAATAALPSLGAALAAARDSGFKLVWLGKIKAHLCAPCVAELGKQIA